MLQALFAVPVLVTDLGISERERSVLRECALAAYRANNTNGKPWSRANRESLADRFFRQTRLSGQLAIPILMIIWLPTLGT